MTPATTWALRAVIALLGACMGVEAWSATWEAAVLGAAVMLAGTGLAPIQQAAVQITVGVTDDDDLEPVGDTGDKPRRHN